MTRPVLPRVLGAVVGAARDEVTRQLVTELRTRGLDDAAIQKLFRANGLQEELAAAAGNVIARELDGLLGRLAVNGRVRDGVVAVTANATRALFAEPEPTKRPRRKRP